jgi:hypothetical protein
MEMQKVIQRAHAYWNEEMSRQVFLDLVEEAGSTWLKTAAASQDDSESLAEAVGGATVHSKKLRDDDWRFEELHLSVLHLIDGHSLVVIETMWRDVVHQAQALRNDK